MIHPKPQEIRTGNYFKILTGIYVEITSVDRVGLIEYIEFGNPMEEYEDSTTALFPIELTKEWIVKLGIEKDDVGYKIENDNFIFKLLFYDCWNIMYNEKEGYGGSECLIRAFPYVHELQNIFFTLSGQELTIKE